MALQSDAGLVPSDYTRIGFIFHFGMESVRCLTCNAVLNFMKYHALRDDSDGTVPAAKVFELMSIRRFCCRRMYLSHPEELEEHLRCYPLRNSQHPDYSLHFETANVCEVATD